MAYYYATIGDYLMPKLTPEMEEKILEEYKKRPVLKEVAKSTGVDERTVKRLVERDRTKREKSTPSPIGTSTSRVKDVAVAIGEAGSKVDTTNITDQTAKKEEGSAISAASGRREDERLKIVYTEFKAGKKPYDIVADHGYDPEFVEMQYSRYLKQKDCDPVEFQSEILAFYDATRKSKFKPYDDSFKKNGCIKANEMIELLNDIAIDRADINLKMMLRNREVEPPEGWCKLRCTTCGEVHSIMRVFEKSGPLVSGGIVKYLICKSCMARASGVPMPRL